ncbi:heterokaryon incompatibility protein-domain-containing protein [Cercophora samala]|uniref:Heterokaryon incompatibility protein-domain-containing protein n=1 Tax=Cercophora samala TaxID=330535 RepID=A0AA39ZJF0_9PEZI|nr:heterokaryon incompatibility protein-domain-containing protein [Cercophora samala]
MMDDERYQYKPLPTATSIRVLKLEGVHRGTFCVSLECIDLADDPDFCALSYTWGNPHANGVDFTEYFNSVSREYSSDFKAKILCHGKHISIQTNLVDFFQELQSSLEHQGKPFKIPHGHEFRIWIDAVCINQDDLQERAFQVKMMGDVYRKAAHTIIWLGRGDQYTKDAVKTISKVAACPRSIFAQSSITPFRQQDNSVYEAINVPYISWSDWCSLAAFFKRQWFSRLWIVQEVILSRELSLLCGDHHISWDELVAAARTIEARCDVLGFSPSTLFIQAHEIAVALEHNTIQLARWREFYYGTSASKPHANIDFESLIYDTWIFSATDPRDKVYGMFGLMKTNLKSKMTVDYTTPVEVVYALTTKHMIDHSSSLQILTCVQDSSIRKIRPSPSWTPDFSLPYFNMMCSNGFFSVAGPNQTKAQLLSSSSWDRLRLRGYLFDTIVETGDDRTDHVNSSVLLDPSWFELCMLLSQPYQHTGESRTEVLWRTLCANQTSGSAVPAPEDFGTLFKELLSAMIMVRAEVESEGYAEAAGSDIGPPADCCTGFLDALNRARDKWAFAELDTLSREEIMQHLCKRPRFLSSGRHGWLIYTLTKLHILALTEDKPNTPSWEELEQFYHNPTYIMRRKKEKEIILVRQKDERFSASFQKRYGKRKLFFTEKGYLGLGPASCKVGDVIAILPGAEGPFVLRHGHPECDDDDENKGKGNETEQVMSLVGQAYVHGIMNGEAVEEDGFELQDIELA